MKSAIFILVIILAANSVNAQNLLLSPESAIFDEAHNRYLVSNYANGDIIAIDMEGNQSYFNADLWAVAGLHIVGNTLYAASSSGLKGFDLDTGELLMDISYSYMDILNGITSDTSGYLYVTDYGENAKRIYRILIADQSLSVIYIDEPLLNGITFDAESNRLLTVSNYSGDNKIRAISLDDFSVTIVASTGFSTVDGLTRDINGSYYFSDWGTDAIYKFNSDFTIGPTMVQSGFSNPADINFNLRDNILVVPNFGDNTLDLIPFPDSDSDGLLDINDNCVFVANINQGDTDGDGVGDVCDLCPNGDDNLDNDSDGVPDYCDVCNGFDDNADFDEDEIADGCDNCPEHFNPGQEDSNSNDVGDLCDYLCGDADGEQPVNILDIVYLINFKYKGGPSPEPLEAADVNSDLLVNILDIVYLINYKYKSGPEPQCVV